MPLRNPTDDLAPSRGEIAHFSALAQTKAVGARDIVNAEELNAWLADLLHGRFGSAADKAGEPSPTPRQAACERWTRSVARKWMIRQGQTESHEPTGEALERSPAWIRQALAEGRAPQRLALASFEREALAGALDWMRSDNGPALGSDWSRISVEQAIAAEKKWIEAMARAALKKDLDAADAAGTSLFAESPAPGPDGRSGWRWVEVRSKEALDREGALMRHCVGSYAEDVAFERKSIFSLRDPDNKPKLTLETQQGKIAQLKAFANESCPPELFSRVVDFANAFGRLCKAKSWPIEVDQEVEAAGIFSVPGVGLAIAGSPLPEELCAHIATDISQGRFASSESLPAFAGVGWVEPLELVLPHASEERRNQALVAAAAGGQSFCVQRLLPLSDPKADDSRALRVAAGNGQREIVELLLPASDPKAGKFSALAYAAASGHREIVELLLPLSDPKADESFALAFAAGKGQREIVELLLPVSDPNAGGSCALSRAAASGHSEIVELLLPVCDPKANESLALTLAVKGGYRKIVELLLPVSDPKARSSCALALAAKEGHCEIVELLLPVSNPTDYSRALQAAKTSHFTEIASLIQAAMDARMAAPAPELPALGSIGFKLAQTRRLEPLAAPPEARPDPRRAG